MGPAASIQLFHFDTLCLERAVGAVQCEVWWYCGVCSVGCALHIVHSGVHCTLCIVRIECVVCIAQCAL